MTRCYRLNQVLRSDQILMKIAYLVPYITQSGPVNVVRHLCDVLQDTHEVDVYYFKNFNDNSFSVSTSHINFFSKIDFDAYDIIHSHGVLPDAYVWWHKNSIKKTKTITTLHNYVKEDYKYAYNPIKAYLLEKAWNIVTSQHDKAVTLSKDAVTYYQSFWKNKNLVFVYNGIPLLSKKKTAFSQQFIQSNVRIGAIGSGSITKRKGFDQIIRALIHLPQCTLHIAGGGQEIQNLKELAIECNVMKRVYFEGFQNDITIFIHTMDLFVVPSRSEGFSLALQEVARQKKPVVCSDIPLFRELLSEKEVSFFTLDDINSLTKAIRTTIDYKDTFSKNIFHAFKTSYTASIMAKNYIDLYKNCIETETL